MSRWHLVTGRQGTLARLARSCGGFTLTELVIVIAVLGIVAAISIPVIGTFIASAGETATKDELRTLARAIAGSNELTDRGFEGDVGFPPSSLSDLVSKPDSIAPWDAFLDVGWNGPYVDSTGGEYLRDAWDSAYVYDPAARTIVSVGSGSSITVSF
jgi:prepilin-type N-terminal cleavage/methylation domain-containing protein